MHPKYIGGTAFESRTVQVSDEKGGKKLIWLRVRMPLFKVDLGVIAQPLDHAGKLLVPQWEELVRILPAGANRRTFVWRAEHLFWHVVSSVYHAQRQAWHILAKYGIDLATGEKLLMHEAMAAARDLNLAVLGLRAGARLDQMQDATRAKIAAIAENVGRPIKLSKREAAEQTIRVAVGVDRAGRVNVSAMAARSRAIRERLRERLEEEMMVIEPHIRSRRVALDNMVHLAHARLSGTDDFLNRLLAHDGLRPTFDPDRCREVAHQCEFWAQELETVDFRPYRNACQETARDLREVRDLLRRKGAGDLLSLRKILAKCRNAIAIKNCQANLEDLIFEITRAQTGLNVSFNPVQTQGALERIGKGLVAIDERGFRRAVCQAAAVHLRNAYRLLNQPNKLKETREELKKASELL